MMNRFRLARRHRHRLTLWDHQPRTTPSSFLRSCPFTSEGAAVNPPPQIKVKAVPEFYQMLVENSRGLSVLGGFAAVVGGVVAFNVQSKEAIKHNKALNDANIASNKTLTDANIASNKAITDANIASNKAMTDANIASNKAITDANIALHKTLIDKDLSLLQKEAELTSLKNLLLFGQSEEYKGMRQSFASHEEKNVAKNKKE
jgi:hypothetical protein